MSVQPLVEVLLAGTGRQVPPPAALPDLADQSPETRVLAQSALDGVRLLAGRVPRPVDGVAAPPSPPDDRPDVPPAAAARLHELLTERPELLPEWLELAAAAERRAPNVLLPALIDYAAEHAEPRDAVIAMGGPRLQWLAAQRAEWAFAAPLDRGEALTTGTRPQRVRALRAWRRVDPTAAREWLANAWAREDAQSRAALLAELAEGLSLADEALLEQVLADSRKEVRDESLLLLRRLQGSAFGERWRERAADVVQLKSRLLRTTVEVHEPREVPPQWVRDGFESRVPTGQGQTAWWLRQLMSLTPPDAWPTSMLGPFTASDWREPLLAGLAETTAAYAHDAWAEALIQVWPRFKDPRAAVAYDVAPLFAALSAEAAERVLWRTSDHLPAAAVHLLPAWRFQGGAELSRHLAERLSQLLAGQNYNVHSPLNALATHLDPVALPEFRRAAAAITDPVWMCNFLERAADTLELRAAMRKELS